MCYLSRKKDLINTDSLSRNLSSVSFYFIYIVWFSAIYQTFIILYPHCVLLWGFFVICNSLIINTL